MSENNQGEKPEMKTSTTPHSLADVAATRALKTPGTAPLGSGLEARSVHAWFGSKHVLRALQGQNLTALFQASLPRERMQHRQVSEVL